MAPCAGSADEPLAVADREARHMATCARCRARSDQNPQQRRLGREGFLIPRGFLGHKSRMGAPSGAVFYG